MTTVFGSQRLQSSKVCFAKHSLHRGRSTKSRAPPISGIRLARRAEHRQPNKIKCPRPTARPSVSWPVIGFDAKLLSNPPFDLPMGAQIGNERECICKLSLNGSVCAVSLKTMDIGHSL
ncbi:hypothetical protein HZ326_6260 [Fusarium oxysporum f. sp. albedinis]|nr:hypothetical protein HZ326_6260 [Fusarium oxysporum f. sp. albedinis]